ncbi:hypothetical protein D6D15_01013 [Aureobasidium pullulans]|uniref:REJ domain-containing protein n=1 Tax=Aureobasidium pullulans TaxID=5580 RepID=A0A4S9BSY8_AURPU|nr:hypothetical protein D6D15_01013 [Aureobasidium pullulans]
MLWFFVWIQFHQVAAFKGVYTWRNFTFSPRSSSNNQSTTFTTIISTSTQLSTISSNPNETIFATSTIHSFTTVVSYTTILADPSLSASISNKTSTANLNSSTSLTTSSLSLSSIITTAISSSSTASSLPTTMSTSTLTSDTATKQSLSSSSSSVSPTTSPISSTATALLLLTSATAAVSQAITPGVAADYSNTSLQVVAAASSSGRCDPEYFEYNYDPNSIYRDQLYHNLNESLSSVSITSSTTSIASVLTASGSPTISPTTTSSAIPSSILILPTTTPPSSSSSTTSSTSTSSTATATVSSDSSNTTASATTSKSTTNHLSSQEIAGISFGAVAAAAILSLLLFALYRHRRARQAAAAAAANDKHNSFPESAWLYDPRMTPSPPSAAAIAATHNHTPSVISSIHSSISSSASRRDTSLLSAIATPALLPQRQTSNHIGRALTSNPPVTAASKRHRISSSVPEFKLLPKTPSAAAVDATPLQTKRESLPAILKIGHGGKSRPVTVAPAAAGPSLLGSSPNKPLPPRPVIAAKDRPFSFEAGDDGAQQFGIAK